jgi:hypothetical protein
MCFSSIVFLSSKGLFFLEAFYVNAYSSMQYCDAALQHPHIHI